MPGSEETKGTRNMAMVRTEAAIARTREEVAQSVDALRREITRRAHWRVWFRRRPGLFLAGALALGFYLGRR